MFEYALTRSNAGIEIELRGLQFCAFTGQHMLMFTGTAARSPQMEDADFERHWKKVKPLMQAIAGSIYIPGKWATSDGRGKPQAEANPVPTMGLRHKSKEFGFSAVFPEKVEPTVLRYDMGKMATFQAADTNNNLIVMVTADIVPAAGFLVAADESTPEKLIEAMVDKGAQEKGAIDGTLSKKWGSLNGRPALEFSFATDTFAPKGVRTYHRGRTTFDLDTFYNLQVVSFEENQTAEKALASLAESLIIRED
jgi:hypothetical protein